MEEEYLEHDQRVERDAEKDVAEGWVSHAYVTCMDALGKLLEVVRTSNLPSAYTKQINEEMSYIAERAIKIQYYWQKGGEESAFLRGDDKEV